MSRWTSEAPGVHLGIFGGGGGEVASRHSGYERTMTETPVPPSDPDDPTRSDGIPEPDESPAPPLEPSVTNPDADGTDAVPS